MPDKKRKMQKASLGSVRLQYLLLWLFLRWYTYRTILKLLTYLCQSVRPDYFLLLLILYTNYVCLHTILAILKCIFFVILPWSKYLIKYLLKYLIKYFDQCNSLLEHKFVYTCRNYNTICKKNTNPCHSWLIIGEKGNK